MGNSASTERSSSPVRGVDALKAFISSVDSCPNSSARNEDKVSGDFLPVPNHSLNYEDAPLDTGYCGEVENPEDLNFMTLQASFLSSLLPIKNKASQDQTLYDVLRSQRFSLNCIEYVTMCASFILSALEMYGQCIPQDVAIINDRSYYMMHTLEKLQEFLSKMKFNHWNLEHILERESTCRNCDVKQILFRHVTLKNISKSSSFCLVCMLFLPKEEVVVHISSDGHKRLKENLQAEMYPHDCGKCPLRFCKQDDLHHHLSQHRSGSDVKCEKERFNLFCCYLCKITLENKRDLREHMKTSIEHALKKEIAMEVNLRSKIASQHYSSDMSCATNVDSPLEVLHGVTNNLKVEQKSFQHHSSSIEAVVKNSSPEQIWIEIEQPKATLSHKIKTGYKFPSPTQSINLSSLTKSNDLDSVPPSLESVDVAEEPDVNDHVKLVSHNEEIQNFPVGNFCGKQSYFSGTGYEVDTKISGCFMDIEMVTDSAKTVPTIGPQLADVKNNLPAEQIWFEIKQPKKDECSSLKPSVMGGLSSDVTLHHIPSEYYCCTCQKKVPKANKVEHEKGKRHTELLQASEEASSKLSFEPNVIKTKYDKRNSAGAWILKSEDLDEVIPDEHKIEDAIIHEKVETHLKLCEKFKTISKTFSFEPNGEKKNNQKEGEDCIPSPKPLICETTLSHKIKTGYKFPSPTQSINLSSLTKSNGLDSVPPSLESVDVAEELLVLENNFIRCLKEADALYLCSLCNVECNKSVAVTHLLGKRHLCGDWIKKQTPDLIEKKLKVLMCMQSFNNIYQTSIKKATSRIGNLLKQRGMETPKVCLNAVNEECAMETVSESQDVLLDEISSQPYETSKGLSGNECYASPDVNDHVKLVSHDKEIQNFPVSNFCGKQSYFSGTGYEVDTKISDCFMDIEMVTDSAKTVPVIGPQLADVKNSLPLGLPAEQIWFEIEQPKKDECSSLKPSVMGGLSSDVTLHHIPSEYYCCTCQKKVPKANKMEHEKGKRHTELLQASEEASSKLSFEPNVIKKKCDKSNLEGAWILKPEDVDEVLTPEKLPQRQSLSDEMKEPSLNAGMLDGEDSLTKVCHANSEQSYTKFVKNLFFCEEIFLKRHVEEGLLKYQCILCNSVPPMKFTRDKMVEHLLRRKHIRNWLKVLSLEALDGKLRTLTSLQTYNVFNENIAKAIYNLQCIIGQKVKDENVNAEILMNKNVSDDEYNSKEKTMSSDSMEMKHKITEANLSGEPSKDTCVSPSVLTFCERETKQAKFDLNSKSILLAHKFDEISDPATVLQKLFILEQDFLSPLKDDVGKYSCSLCSLSCQNSVMVFHLLGEKHLNDNWFRNQPLETVERKLETLRYLQMLTLQMMEYKVEKYFQTFNSLEGFISKAISRIENMIHLEGKKVLTPEKLPQRQSLSDEKQNYPYGHGCAENSVSRDVIFIGETAANSLQDEFLQACGSWDSEEFDVECGVCGVLFPIYNEDIEFSLDMHAQNDPQHSLAIAVPVERDAPKVSETCKNNTSSMRKPSMSSVRHKLVTKETFSANNKKEVLKVMLELENSYISMDDDRYYCNLCSLFLKTDSAVVHHCLLPIHMSKKWASNHTTEMLQEKYEKIESLKTFKYACVVIENALSRLIVLISSRNYASRNTKNKKNPQSSNSLLLEPKVNVATTVFVPSSSVPADYCATCCKEYTKMKKKEKRSHNSMCKQSDPAALYFCDVCKSVMGVESMSSHLKGKRHLRALKKTKFGQASCDLKIEN